MKRYLLLLPLLVLSCGLWTPMQAPPTQAATVTKDSTGVTGEMDFTRSYTPTPERVAIFATLCTVTASDYLNVRSGPGTNYPAISWLRSGDVVTVRDISGAWLKLDAGWIHGGYCGR